MASWRSGVADCGQLASALAKIREDSSDNTAHAAPFAFSLFSCLGYFFLQSSCLTLPFSKLFFNKKNLPVSSLANSTYPLSTMIFGMPLYLPTSLPL